jgi:hypothetical protein
LVGTDDDAPGLTGVNWNYDVQSRLFERDGLCTLTDLIDKHFVLTYPRRMKKEDDQTEDLGAGVPGATSTIG